METTESEFEEFERKAKEMSVNKEYRFDTRGKREKKVFFDDLYDGQEEKEEQCLKLNGSMEFKNNTFQIIQGCLKKELTKRCSAYKSYC